MHAVLLPFHCWVAASHPSEQLPRLLHVHRHNISAVNFIRLGKHGQGAYWTQALGLREPDRDVAIST